MHKLGVLLCLMLLAFACGGGDTLPAAPSPADPLPPRPPPLPLGRAISVGQEIKEALTVHGEETFYELTAPSDGTLVARLTWDPGQGRLELELGDTWFTLSSPSLPPIVGKLPVTTGQKYRVRVADGAPWDYDNLLLPFVLTTSIE